MSCLGWRINIKLANSTFKLYCLLVKLSQHENPIRIQCVIFLYRQTGIYSLLPTRSIQSHYLALNINGHIVPLAIVDIVIKIYRLLVTHINYDFARDELQPELKFFLFASDRE